MLNSTFFKFLITFVVIIGVSFFVMNISGCFNDNNSATANISRTIVK